MASVIRDGEAPQEPGAGGDVSDPQALLACCLDEADEAVWVLDAVSGRLLYANARAGAWFGSGSMPAAAGSFERAGGGLVAVDVRGAREGAWLVGRARPGTDAPAARDALTAVPNRFLLQELGEGVVAAARRARSCVAVVCIDLDGFSAINESYGHRAGDRLLQEAALRLRGCVRESDVVGRLGSDEFVLVLGEAVTRDAVAAALARASAALAQPFALETGEVHIGATFGVAVFPEDGESFECALRSAGAALGRAKRLSRGSWRFYSDGEAGVSQPSLASELRFALEREEFAIHYQPRFLCPEGRLSGFEALLRWDHPVRGVLLPEQFLGMLEHTGLIIPLGRWILASVCRQFACWRGAGDPQWVMAVNLSARQAADPGLADFVAECLADHAIPAQCLEFDIPERVLMEQGEALVEPLTRLKALGVRLAVDDFGTGFASLTYLKRFPLDVVKIDRSLVRSVSVDPAEGALALAVIDMAHQLKLRVLAEGVEREAQLALLSAQCCDELQGFLFCAPLSAAELDGQLVAGMSIEPGRLARAERPRTLLLVDDEENILSALRRLLRREGYRTLTAGSGAEGLALLAEQEVDVIVSDQRMPGMTGVEFLRKAKELHPETVRMVLSGYTDLQSVTDAINEGDIYKFLTKPWDDALLKANIDEAFRRKALSDENRMLTRQVQVANIELMRVNAHLQDALAAQSRRLEVGKSLVEAWQAVIEALPLPVLGVDGDGLVALVNSAALAEIGSCAEVGAAHRDVLPAELAGLVDGGGGAAHVVLCGRKWLVRCSPLPASDRRNGFLYAFLPEVS